MLLRVEGRSFLAKEKLIRIKALKEQALNIQVIRISLQEFSFSHSVYRLRKFQRFDY